MLRHRLRSGAWHLAPWRSQRDHLDFYHGLLDLGYAVASSSYSQPGWALFKTNEDLEQMVTEFKDEFGVPSDVILAGAGLGGLVIVSALAKADLGNVTGALMLCGAVAGSRNWDGALDLRLLYDTICTKKKTRIPGGPKGLEKNSDWTSADVEKAVRTCFGTPAKRKKKQQKRLDKFVELARISEEFVEFDMWYATFGMADLVYDKKKMKGKQGVGNAKVDYGDEAINEDIERFSPKESKAKRIGKFYTPDGNVGDAKIISLHTDKDGFVAFENQSELAGVVPPDQLTIGVVVEDTPTHCGFNDVELLGTWEALYAWLDGGPQPTAADLQTSCLSWVPFFGGTCRIDPDSVIPDIDDRIRPRG